MKTPEKNLYSQIRQSPCKLHIIIFLPTMLAVKRAEQHFSEERNVNKQNDGGACLVAAWALSFSLCGFWVVFHFDEGVGCVFILLHLVFWIINLILYKRIWVVVINFKIILNFIALFDIRPI